MISSSSLTEREFRRLKIFYLAHYYSKIIKKNRECVTNQLAEVLLLYLDGYCG
jgi:hypothetical protein